jgi:dTDP-4-amino-4,6-dideoxygalactose transaminase
MLSRMMMTIAGALPILATHQREVQINLGVLQISNEHRVQSHIEKPTYRYTVSTGIYVFETRSFFYPMYVAPSHRSLAANRNLPLADHLSIRGFSLPSWARLIKEDVAFICDTLIDALGAIGNWTPVIEK